MNQHQRDQGTSYENHPQKTRPSQDNSVSCHSNSVVVSCNKMGTQSMGIANQKNWICYILECNDGTLYTGITNRLDKRIDTHNKGKGSKYVAARTPAKLVFSSEYLGSRGHAAQYERQVKSMSRQEKLKLIDSPVNKHINWRSAASML